MARSGTLNRRLDLAAAGPAPGVRVGVEHELAAFDSRGRVDFRRCIGDVAGRVQVADPGDPRARRLASGLMLTADGWEAELATPPVPLDPAAPERLGRMLDQERARLLTALRTTDPGARLVGFSTHVNVSVGDGVVLEVAQEFAHRCAVAAMLLLDGADSPGLLVRPRRYRLEICGEYASGADLAAAVTFVAAAAQLLQSGTTLPRVGAWRVEPARERFGHFVSRTATGTDLYADGRAAWVSAGGSRVRAQEHLEQVWDLVRPFAVAQGLDPAPVDDRVAGAVLLPVERSAVGTGREAPVPDVAAEVCPATGSGEGLILLDPETRTRRRGDLVLAPAWLTWTTVAWACRDTSRGRTAYAVMPVDAEAAFLALVDRGELDALLARAAGRRLLRRVLVSNDQVARPGVWQGVRPHALVPAERGRTGAPGSAGGGRAGGDDPAKDRQDETSRQHRDPDPGPVMAGALAGTGGGLGGGMIALLLVATLVLGGAVWAVATRGGEDPVTPAAASPATEPTLEPTPEPTEPSPEPTADPVPANGEPFPPGPEDLAVLDISGTYRVTRTVVESENLTAPIGTVDVRVWTLGTCEGFPCTVSGTSSLPGQATPGSPFEVVLDGASLTYAGESAGACFDPATGEELDPDGAITTVDDDLTVTMVAREDGRIVPSALTGTRVLSGRVNENAEGCEDSEVLPIIYDIVATREAEAPSRSTPPP